tara:strand:+ start:485 stop:1393 length:909 start_codon:yes stop_codon:yes gene_type:complete
MEPHFSEKHRNTAFSNNVTTTLRQEPGLGRQMAGSTENYSGNSKARIENRFGRLTMQEKTERNGDTDNTELNSVARWIKPGRTKTVAPMIDPDDQMEVSLDLGSPAIAEVAEAAAAYHDDMLFKAFFGVAYTGESGDTPVPFKNGNIIGHGGTGLTYEKIVQVRALMRKRNAPLKREMPIWYFLPEDEADLERMEEYKSFDYNGARPLEDGELKPFMGFRWMPINPDRESLPESYDNFFEDNEQTRVNPIVFPKGMHMGIWDEFSGYIDRLPGKNQSTQYWGGSRVAGARTDEDLAFIVKNQ